MTYPPSLDDTQPRPVKPMRVKEPPSSEYTDASADYYPPEGRARGMSGCVTLLILTFVGVIGVIIVVFAALAGWTSGQRQAAVNAMATQNAAIQEQLARIPGDVAAGNMVLLQARIDFLATLTPGVPQVPDLWTTATALAGQFQSSAVTEIPAVGLTPTSDALGTTAPTPTLNIADALLSPTPDANANTNASGMNLDLNALLIEAQGYLATSRWQDAIDTLDVIIAVDPNFQMANVRTLMIDALSRYALQLYNAGQPAAANVIASRIEEFGSLPGDISYERYAAQLILDARASVGVNFPQAIRMLRGVMDLGVGGRYYVEAQQLLYEQYVAYGDAYTFENNWCSAAQQYQNAISVFSSGVANGKYSNANTLCQTPPTIDPNAPPSTLPAGFVPLGQ